MIVKCQNKYFAEYTGIEVKQFRETLLQHMSNVKKSVAERIRKSIDVDLGDIGISGTESVKADYKHQVSGMIHDTNDSRYQTIYDENQWLSSQRVKKGPGQDDGVMLNNMVCAEEIESMLEIKVYKTGSQEEIFSSEAWRRVFDINEPIYTELCHEFYSTYDFDEVCANDELRTKKINEVGFDVYFQGGLLSDANFNAGDYWLSISSVDELHLSRSLASTIWSPILRNGYANVVWLMAKWLKRKGVGSQKDSMICYGQLIMKMAKKMRLLTDEVVPEDLAPGVPRVAILRGLGPSMQDLYERMGGMEIRQGEIERIAHRQSYQWDMYHGVFEHMAGVYDVPLQGAYNPPGYDQQYQQYQQYYQKYE
ncbi:hypothetical protein Tco_0633402 [Tanacetum coccineum]